jgi:hypothetical protein
MPVGTSLLWLSVTALAGVVCAVGAARQYARTGETNRWAVACVAVACAGCLELAMANGHLPVTTAGNAASLVASAVAVVAGVGALLARDGRAGVSDSG